ncbi:hypothetical protein D3C78_1621050 [compost metagenome]
MRRGKGVADNRELESARTQGVNHAFGYKGVVSQVDPLQRFVVRAIARYCGYARVCQTAIPQVQFGQVGNAFYIGKLILLDRNVAQVQRL